MSKPSLRKQLPLHSRLLLMVFAPLGRFLYRLGFRPFAERCSWCHKDLPVGAALYIEGRRVCAECAERGRRRMLLAAWAFIALTVIAAVVAVVGVVMSFRRGDPDAWFVLPIMVVVVLFPLACLWFALWVMKSANRNAGQTEQAIALFKTLESMRDEPEPPSTPLR
jgi:hypothetical protein